MWIQIQIQIQHTQFISFSAKAKTENVFIFVKCQVCDTLLNLSFALDVLISIARHEDIILAAKLAL